MLVMLRVHIRAAKISRIIRLGEGERLLVDGDLNLFAA